MRLPEGRPVRRFLFGNKHGRGSSLHEWYAGKGLVLETSLNLIESFDTEPAAGEFLARCLERVRAFEPALKSVAAAVIGDETLCAYAASLGVDLERLNEPQDLAGRPLVFVGASTGDDAKRLHAWRAQLARYVSAGGTVLFSPVTEETLAAVKTVAGRDELALTEPFFHENTYCIKAPVSWMRRERRRRWSTITTASWCRIPFEPNLSPLLSGIGNVDLNWGGEPMFARGIELKGMDPVAATPEYNLLISNWHINSEPGKSLYGEMLNGVRDLRQNAWFVNRDAVVFQVNKGRGSFIFNQLLLRAGHEASARVMTQLLTNLGVSMVGARAPDADAVYDYAPQNEQRTRFARYAKQIEPGVRRHHGLPNPMPAYLKETKIGVDWHESLPVLGFVGDELSLATGPRVG